MLIIQIAVKTPVRSPAKPYYWNPVNVMDGEQSVSVLHIQSFVDIPDYKVIHSFLPGYHLLDRDLSYGEKPYTIFN